MKPGKLAVAVTVIALAVFVIWALTAHGRDIAT